MINISVKGKYRPKNTSLKVCKLAIQFAADKLIGPRLQENISIKLWFSPAETSHNNWFGYCDWIDDSFRPREFEIAVDPGLRYHDLITTLLHETVHVKQYALGELKEYARTSGSVGWKGKIYRDDRSDSIDSPWEVEARTLEKKLYRQFKEYVKNSV